MMTSVAAAETIHQVLINSLARQCNMVNKVSDNAGVNQANKGPSGGATDQQRNQSDSWTPINTETSTF